MKKILFYLALIIIAVLSSCNCDSKPKHNYKYTISIPALYDYGGGTYHTDNYTSLDNGAIEFMNGNSIYRYTDCRITVNY